MTRPSWFSRRASLTLLTVAGALLLTGVGAAPAAAHDELVSSNPASDSVLETAPAEVELTFSGNISPDFNQVAVVDADDVNYTDGDPVTAGDTVTQPIHDLPAGEYQLAFRIVSGDGHPVDGSLAFTVENGLEAAVNPLPEGAEPSEPAEPEAPAEDATATTDGDAAAEENGSMPLIIGALVAVAIIGLIVALVVLNRRRSSQLDSDGGAEE